MKVRSEILKARAATLLVSVMAIVTGSVGGALAADQAPVWKAPPAAEAGWYFNGGLEFGWLGYIERPPSGFGYNGSGGFLLPTQTNSRAKFEEYGKIPPGLFLDWINLNAGSKDGRYAFDFWGKHVGWNSQSYVLDVAEVGKYYLTLGWDQTPHLYSTSAKSVFGGVGGTNLTVDPALRATLQGLTACVGFGCFGPVPLANRQTINDLINSSATGFDIATRRDKFIVGFRATPTPNWDFKADYTHEDRTGIKPGTMNQALFSFDFQPNVLGIPVPVDDTTHNVNGSGEYAGASSLGRYSVKLAYSGSFYRNHLTQLDVQNPFCITCVDNSGIEAPIGTAVGNNLRLVLPPSNDANALTVNAATDLPFYHSRLATTLQFNRMTQNSAFVGSPMAGADPLPASSLNGEVTTFLTNNVLTSKFSPDVWNKLRVRYYERNNNTAILAFGNVVQADNWVDGGIGLPEYTSYKTTDINEEVKWRTPLRWLTLGTGYDFVRWDRSSNRFTHITDENIGRVFADATPTKWAHYRASYSYGQRRYDNYNIDSLGAFFNPRMFDLANRDQHKAMASVDLIVNKFVTVTPSGHLRWTDYPDPQFNKTGVLSDHAWDVGIAVGIMPIPTLRLAAGYTYEQRQLNQAAAVADAGGAGVCGWPGAGFFTGTLPSITVGSDCTWQDNLKQQYHTLTTSADWNVIPNKFDLRFEYTASWAREAHGFTPCSLNNNNCNGVVTTGTPANLTRFPDETTTFQRFNVIARHFVDPELVHRMGWNGQVIAKLRYTWERNSGSFWASDALSPYFASLTNPELTGTSRSLWMSYYNPNYTAQLIVASLALRW